MLIVIIFGAMLLPVAAHGANRTIYVALSGSDDSYGTISDPFRSIQKAADTAQPGDHIFVMAGEYRESVTLKKSGGPEAPIIFEGARGPKGEWLTIIDPSIPLTSWAPAPEVGVGVFKTDKIVFGKIKSIPNDVPGIPREVYGERDYHITPRCMTAQGRHLARIRDDLMNNSEGVKLFSLSPHAMVNLANSNKKINYWDGIEALYGWRKGTTYIRFRNGINPSTMDIRIAPAGAAWLIHSSYNIIRGFLVRGAEHGLVIEGKESSNNIIEQCSFRHGRNRIIVQTGAVNTVIQDNELTLDYFGGEPGAWLGATENDWDTVRYHIYSEFKNIIGYGGSDDNSILVRNDADDTIIRRNHIHSGLIGVSAYNIKRPDVHHNIIHNMSSIGIETGAGVIDGLFHDNLVYDCNINMRLHHYNEPGAGRREYHYRNCFYLPSGKGAHIYVHNNDTPSPNENELPEINIYHNTYVGGLYGMGVGNGKDNLLTKTTVLNNIFSTESFLAADVELVVKANAFDVWDYNLLGGVSRYMFYNPFWFGNKNIFSSGKLLWPHEQLPNFRLPEGSSVQKKGVDLSKPFTIKNKNHKPLPGMLPYYFVGEAPDLGALQANEILTVGPTR